MFSIVRYHQTVFYSTIYILATNLPTSSPKLSFPKPFEVWLPIFYEYTEAQSSEETCPRPHSWLVGEPELELGESAFFITDLFLSSAHVKPRSEA